MTDRKKKQSIVLIETESKIDKHSSDVLQK